MIAKFQNAIFATLLLTTVLIGQDNLSLIFKAGQAKYNIGMGSFGGGGPYYTFWNEGYHIAAGIEFPLNENLSFQGLGEYSSFNFDTWWAFGERANNAKNRVFDLMGNIKWNLGIFYFIGGVGFSAQIGDEIKYLDKTESHDIETLFPAKNKFVFAGLLGLGFDIKVYGRFSLIAEANIRMREYAGATALLGLKYDLW